VSIAELQHYGYFALTIMLTIGLYAYIYHLYSKKKNSDDIDYEEFSNLALKDDIADTPVNAKSDDKEK
jgi:cytochrome c oxidase cbb3-type subunit 4